ncbi:hypothetical protein IG7_02823 [Bacillus cereus HuA2-4]|nr:hypothetical protein IG7_02823 [Bacillus cereus HuA2-4]
MEISFFRKGETKKEHLLTVLFKIGGNSMSETSRLEVYGVKKK